MRQEMPVGNELGQRLLDVARGDQSDVPLYDLESTDQGPRYDEIAEPDVRGHDFGERADVEHAAMGIESLQGRHRPAVVVEFAVVIVLHDPGLAGPDEGSSNQGQRSLCARQNQDLIRRRAHAPAGREIMRQRLAQARPVDRSELALRRAHGAAAQATRPDLVWKLPEIAVPGTQG